MEKEVLGSSARGTSATTGSLMGTPGSPTVATTWNCGAYRFTLDRTLIMGILNVTPDSFSDGGQHNSPEDAVAFARLMMREGADIIDVGGESTRPGSDEVAIEEELRRTIDVVRVLAAEGIPVSIDTRHPEVARAACEAGACIINDVSGFRDPAMVEVLAAGDAGCVAMHMLGEPKNMQSDPHYDDVVAEISEYLLDQAHMLEAHGVARERICIDPGPGFGKTVQHNLALLDAFERFSQLGYPSMVATSRKAFIGKTYGIAIAADRVWASVSTALRASFKGASVARVHDVEETRLAFEWAACPVSDAHIALGANMGDRIAQLEDAVAELDALVETEVTARSGIYETEPAFNEDQDPFANAVCRISTRLHPKVLLAELHRIELAAGRVRSFANAPRPLDLDIIDYEGVLNDDGYLVLPHPGALSRDFVVTPLLDCSPNLILADGSPVTREHIEFGMVTGKLGDL